MYHLHLVTNIRADNTLAVLSKLLLGFVQIVSAHTLYSGWQQDNKKEKIGSNKQVIS